MNNISTDTLINEYKSLKQQNQRLTRDLKNAKRCIHRLKLQKKKLLDKIKTPAHTKKTIKTAARFFGSQPANKLPKK